MKLQTKAVLTFNALIILVCNCMGILSYMAAEEGLDVTLQRSARSNIKSIVEIVEYRYPGDWQIRNGQLYKGEVKINDNADVVDYLGAVCEGHVTIFQNEKRVATTVKDKSGQRSLGTSASEQIINEVLRGGNPYTGRAEVLGENYDSAYAPIKGGDGQTIGMIFVGLPAKSLQDVEDKLRFITLVAIGVMNRNLSSTSCSDFAG